MRGLAALCAVAAVWLLAGSRPRRPVAGSLRQFDPGPAATAGAAAGLTGLLAFGLTGVGAVALGAAVMAGAIPIAIARRRTERRRLELASSLPDFLIRVRGSLAGGASLPEAFEAAGRASDGRLQLAGRLVATARIRGATFEEALKDARDMLDDPVADRVLSVIAAAHRSGGPRVGSVLESLGRSVSDELRLRDAHEAALTQQRLTALVALVAPWVLLVLTVATNPAAATAYRTGTGSLIVAIGLVATATGYGLARRTARLSRPPRVLR